MSVFLVRTWEAKLQYRQRDAQNGIPMYISASFSVWLSRIGCCTAFIVFARASFSSLTSKSCRIILIASASPWRMRSSLSSRVGRMPVSEPHGGMKPYTFAIALNAAIFTARFSRRFISSASAPCGITQSHS